MMKSNDSRLMKILTDVRTWKIAGIIAIILVLLDIVLYGSFITYEAFQDEDNTSFTAFNSIPADLYINHRDYEINNLKQGISVEQAHLMNNSCDKHGVEHIGYNPKTSKLEIDFRHQPNQFQQHYAQSLVKKFNHSYK